MPKAESLVLQAVSAFSMPKNHTLEQWMFPGSAKQLAGFELRFSGVSTAFPTQRPFSRVKKGAQTAQYSAQSFGAGFMDNAQVQKPAPFFVFIGKGGSSWNKTPISRNSLAACGGRGLNHPYGRCSARGLNKNRISDPEPSRQVETEGEGTGESIRGTAAAPFWGDAAFPVPQAAPEGR